ncbi:MAG: hypothetical protein IKI57_00925 [Clostridia bacterium]|nr:hypothetical protein [Clostridia bacterium]
MKIQHWAIIFIIIIVPFSIVCRNVINNKILTLRDETRYNNIIDNASFDAVAQLRELDNEFGLGKNIPLTKDLMDAVIDRFFNTLCVNFNLPANRQVAEEYFDKYIPAIVIVGYDGLYVYSCEQASDGYGFKLKPKIPYAYNVPGTNCTINFTLDNYVKIFISDETFMNGYELEDGYTAGTHLINGYVGNNIDYNQNGINDFDEGEYNPYGIDLNSESEVKNFLASVCAKSIENDGNLSYFLYTWGQSINWATNSVPAALKDLLITDGKINNLDLKTYNNINFSPVNQDYQYDNDKAVIGDASQFHKLRRKTIIDTITKTLKYEFNEHNNYAKKLGVTYNFVLPAIGSDQWNNTIDDVSVLSFIQGLPIGVDQYYNNYSLGGARLVQSQNIFCEEVINAPSDYGGGNHKVYHRWYCPYIPRHVGDATYTDGSVFLEGDGGTYKEMKYPYAPYEVRTTLGIQEEKKNEADARKAGYFPCKQCCS